MARRRPIHVLVAVAVAGVTSCSFAVDTGDLDKGCADNEKPCDGKCVLIDDPRYGCTLTGCKRTSCDYLGPHAVPTCQDNRCVPKECLDGFGCTDITSHCSFNLKTDNDNCGVCGQACAAPQVCSNGECAVLPP